MTAEEIIKTLNLIPLSEEGGLVHESYRSSVLTDTGEAAGTAIYYMLRGESFSHMHKLEGDEIYHFYMGDPVELTELLPDGTVRRTTLGQNLTEGECVQHLVQAGNWQGSRLKSGGKWALLGTTMCPGYSDKGYTHGDAEELIRRYPEAESEILRLTGKVSY